MRVRVRLAIVADDLTGAADTGVGFMHAGLPTIVMWPVPSQPADGEHPRDGFHPGDDVEVCALDLRTRTMDAAAAVACTTDAVRRLRDDGVSALYKKADSTLRGHFGLEVKACRDAWFPGSVAVVAMAFPAAGRTTVGGRQHVHGDVLGCATIPAMLEASGVRAVHVGLDEVRGPSLPARFEAQRQPPGGAIVCDAVTDDDLEAIVRAGMALGSNVIWVGSGGLARVLARVLAARVGGARRPSPEAGGMSIRPTLIVVGSTSPVSWAQAESLVADGISHIRIPIAALDGTSPEACAAVSAGAARRLREGSDLLLTIDHEVGSGGSNDERLMTRLGESLRHCRDLVGGLIATGGDTAYGILRAWDTRALRLVDEVEPGVPLSVTIGTRRIRVVTKAGAFGSPATLVRAHARLAEPPGAARREH